MPAAAENFSPGMPVEIGKIDRELKKLWEVSGEAMTRASLINLAVYSEAPGSVSANTQLMSRITQNHACRAIVIGANPSASEDRVEAWISAHCHVGKAGSKQICSEQLSFRLDGSSTNFLPSLVFSHLDSDLPFYLWWQSEFHEPMDPQLWAWVDRLIYDSQSWKDFDSQMRSIETAQAEARQRIVLCDLNWTRLVHIRLAVAQFFDHPAAQHHFNEIERVKIDFAPGFKSTAILLAGWLATQLKWQRKKTKDDDAFQFVDPFNRNITFELDEKPGEPIGRVRVQSGKIEFSVSHTSGSDLLEVFQEKRGAKGACQLIPAGSNDPVDLMSEELRRGGPHQVYRRAIECVRDLL
ncbi:MAG: glucose-6-phosphate dehydrogenase assembly protein OpcA [Verrucomicrobiota bacterium]